MPEVKPDVLNLNCGSRQTLNLISDRWSVLVIHALADRPCRYGELGRSIGGISQKMLTETLRALERDGLVERTVYPAVPPHVEYSLTGLGGTLLEPLQALCHWAETHLEEVTAARRAYGQRAASAP